MSTSLDQRRISEMRNLGPACEKDFAAVNITTAKDLIKLGSKKAFLKMLDGRIKIGRSAKCCNAMYLYAIEGAIQDIPWQDLPNYQKQEFKEFAKELRDSGRYS